MKNIFQQIWNKKHFDNGISSSFKEIIGHYETKEILNKAIVSKNPVHILLVGRPGSAKTMFLLEINRLFKSSIFVVGSNTTKAGLTNQLFDRRPRFVLVDELEKMSYSDQNSLLHLMENGMVSETKINKTREMLLHSSVFACANSCMKIAQPLLSRFLVVKIPDYSFEEFMDIAVFQLKKEKMDEMTARAISRTVWQEFENRDIRDVIKIGRLSRNIQEAELVIRILKRNER
ncbi:MAG TPA: AAA family ATPase [Nitrososphaeraceae archaeon]|nr:AAA family ATPase [Nitrososphaeraceae archaeon]